MLNAVRSHRLLCEVRWDFSRKPLFLPYGEVLRFTLPAQSKSGLFGINGIKTGQLGDKTHKLPWLNKQKKSATSLKKKTSRCLIDVCSLRNVVQKHPSELLRTATLVICPGSVG